MWVKKKLGEDSYSSFNKIYVCLGPPMLGPIKLVTYEIIEVIVYTKVFACLSAFGHTFIVYQKKIRLLSLT